MFEYLLLIAFVAVVSVYWAISSARRQERAMRTYIACTPDFTATHVYLGSDGASAIAIDLDRASFCLIRGQPGAYIRRVIPFSAVISSEVHEDGDVIVSTSRPSQLIGAAAGGLVFGGAGAIVGALTGKKKHQSQIQLIELRLIIEDMRAPTFSVPFLSAPTEKSSILYRSAREQARSWHARAEIAIRQTQQVKSALGDTPTDAPRPSE